MNPSPKIKLFGLILLVLIPAFYFRWLSFPFTQIYSDSLSPFVGGVQFFEQGYAKPPNPEADHWLWVSTIPFLSLAASLEELFWFRYLGSVIIIPVSMISVYLLLLESRYRLFATAAVGSFLAVDAGILDTLISSFRGYFAPEYLAVAALGVALFQREKRWGLWIAILSSVLAGGQHPLAMGSFVGLGFLGVLVWRRSRRDFLIGVLIFLCCLIPKMLWIWQIMQCERGGLDCLQAIALSSSEEISIYQQITRAYHDRFWVEMGFAGPFLFLGLWFSRKEPFTQWVLVSMLGVLMLGILISTLRPYHFRALAAPMVIASVLGWVRMIKTFLFIAPLWGGFLAFFPPKPVAWKNNVSIHDQLADVFCGISDPFWVEGYQAEDLDISLQGIAISYWLKGCDIEKIESQAGDLIFLVGDKGLNFPIYFQNQSVVIYQLRSSQKLQLLEQEKRVQGYDFSVLFVPEEMIILH